MDDHSFFGFTPAAYDVNLVKRHDDNSAINTSLPGQGFTVNWNYKFALHPISMVNIAFREVSETAFQSYCSGQ